METIKIRKSELHEFINSDLYNGFQDKPISISRLESYFHNPESNEEDYVLYCLIDNDKLIAFRSVLPDNFGDKPQVHFAWCSGAWVHPDYRRKGLSSMLLKTVEKDWNGKLMYSNYAPEAHALLQKSEKFHLLSQRTGKIFYLYAKTHKILKHRINKILHPFLFLLDIGLKIYAFFKSMFYKLPKSKFRFLASDTANEDFFKAFESREKKCFNRNSEDLKWIISHSWVKNTENIENYYFSYKAKNFYSLYINIFRDNKFVGYAIIQHRDGQVKIPYYNTEADSLNDFANYIINWCKIHKIESLIVFDPILSDKIHNLKNPFIYNKTRTQNIFASWDFKCESPIVSDGDGDFIFT